MNRRPIHSFADWSFLKDKIYMFWMTERLPFVTDGSAVAFARWKDVFQMSK